MTGPAALPGLGLVLDLSHAGFAAVLDHVGARVLARDFRPAGARHENVGDWADSLLRTAGGSFAELAWICVGAGPGSFTGIRIAMAFAQGAALPRDIPLHGFTSFEALHLSFSGAPALAVVPANAGRYYVSSGIDSAGALLEAADFAARADANITVIAPGRTAALEKACAGFAGLWTPEGDWNAAAIAGRARANARPPRPLYLQLSAAEEAAAKTAPAARS